MDDKEGLKQVQQEFLGKLKEFTKEIDPTGPFFLGPEPSLIDFVVAPWVSVSTADIILTIYHEYD